MNIVCSNCHTDHDVTKDELNSLNNSILNCKSCSKNIKIQFCPYCNAFYSITFSNIRSGLYKYKCKKCSKTFSITFDRFSGETVSDPEMAKPVIQEAPKNPVKTGKVEADPVEKKEKAEKREDYIGEKSIQHFSVGELFSIIQKAFTKKKIIASSVGVVTILALSKLFSSIESYAFMNGFGDMPVFTKSFINLFPLAIIFSFFILTASVVAKITIDEIFNGREPMNDDVIRFAMRSTPSIIIGNITLLLLVNSALILFGKIPFLGPVLFSIAFLPLYIVSMIIVVMVLMGIWFYPPIAAHRENGFVKNISNLLIFTKKHNINLLTVVPTIITLTLLSLGIIFLVHNSALTMALSASKAVLNSDASLFFSSVPVDFVKASELSLAGVDSSLFKGLYENISIIGKAGGFILGGSLMVITVLLLSVFISVVSTVSSHFYIMLERGLNIEDRKHLMILAILSMLLATVLQIKKIL